MIMNLFPEEFIQEHHRYFIDILYDIEELESYIEQFFDSIEHTIDPPEYHRKEESDRNCEYREYEQEEIEWIDSNHIRLFRICLRGFCIEYSIISIFPPIFDTFYIRKVVYLISLIVYPHIDRRESTEMTRDIWRECIGIESQRSIVSPCIRGP